MLIQLLLFRVDLLFKPWRYLFTISVSRPDTKSVTSGIIAGLKWIKFKLCQFKPWSNFRDLSSFFAPAGILAVKLDMKSLGGCGCGGYMPEALRFLYRTLSRTKKRYILFIEQLHCSVNHNNLGNKYRPSFRHWNRMYNDTVSIEIGVKALSTAPQTTTNAPKK